jgi:AcrR family transcriptional regulator
MSRWEPNARERLVQAAMELFQKRGYVKTTAAEIAERAGLTERTFFRYFSDKREALFSGSEQLEQAMVDGVRGAAEAASALDAVAVGIEAGATLLQTNRDLSVVRARQALVTAHAELQERELTKMAVLAAALTQALRQRGVAEPAASLTAEVGIAVFKVGFERWLDDEQGHDFAWHVREGFDELERVCQSRWTSA